jgi:hypothetical protein
MEYKIRGNPVICDNMGKPGGQYINWINPGIERQMLQDVTCMWSV